MSNHRIEFYDFSTGDHTMTGPSWERTIEAISPLDAVIKAAETAEPEVLEITCGTDDVTATAYSIGACEFEFHLYVDNTDTAFTLPEHD